MTEKSWLWTTDGTGDGASEYTQADWSDILRVVGACHGFEGVSPDYLNKLAATSPSTETVRVQSGGALVDGKPYRNDANKDLTIDAAVGAGNTRIDRIVLRANWSAQTVRLTVIEGTDAASPTAPAITQTSETTYDILLWQALVDTSGNITLTDERAFSRVDENSLATSVAGDLLEGGGGDPLTISNRTRSFFVRPNGGVDIMGNEWGYSSPGTPLLSFEAYGVTEDRESSGHGNFVVPRDFESSMTAKALILVHDNTELPGNIVCLVSASFGEIDSENPKANNVSTGNQTISLAADVRDEIIAVNELTMTGVDVGDYVNIKFTRKPTDGSDDYEAEIYFFGWLVEYTADS